MTTLGNKIKGRLAELQLTQQELSERAKLSQVMIHKLISGKSTRTSKILDLARALQCDPEWLLSEEPFLETKLIREAASEYSSANTLPGVLRTRRVPLITEVQAGNWTDIKESFQRTDAEEWIETTASVGANSFAVRVEGDSMTNPFGTPSIPHGSIVIIDPGIEAASGKIVLARLQDEDRGTLKKLFVDGPNTYLVALNPAYRPILINEKCVIVGVAKRVEFDL